MCWIGKNCSRDVLHVGKSWEMYWMIEKSVRDALNIKKLLKELCWKWENFVTDVLNQKKLFKSCTACGKIMRDVLNEIKLCKRCAKSEI